MAKFTVTQWAEYLGQLDEPPAGEDLRKEVAEFLTKAGFSGPKALDGVTTDEIFELQDAPGRVQVHERALIRRLLRVATAPASPRPPAGSGRGQGVRCRSPTARVEARWS